MLVLAAVNRLKLVPRIAASNYTPAAMLLWCSILAELALGLVILLVVGALGVTPLGADASSAGSSAGACQLAFIRVAEMARLLEDQSNPMYRQRWK